MTSIAIMNAKGGVGKSTLTMAIAETLAEYHGKSSLIIDADGQMSISLMMAPGALLAERRKANLSLVGYLASTALERRAVDWPHYVCRDVSDVDGIDGIFLIPGDMDLPLLEREIAAKDRVSEFRTAARRILAEARQYVDVVLVDCAPGISVMIETWLRECDQHIIPVKPDFLAVSGLEYLRRFRTRNPEMGFAAHLGVVINMQEKLSPPDQVMAAHLREDLDLRCFDAAIPMSPHLQKAALYSAEQRSYVAKYAGDVGSAIRSITKELLDRTASDRIALTPPPPPPVPPPVNAGEPAAPASASTAPPPPPASPASSALPKPSVSSG